MECWGGGGSLQTSQVSRSITPLLHYYVLIQLTAQLKIDF